MRVFSPSASLVIDTNILLGTVLGIREGAALPRVARRRMLMMSGDAATEARLVIERVGPMRRERLERALSTLEIVERAKYAANIEGAGRSLRLAPASRNGSVSDAHILALAWTYDADIWSHDRDFAGTGWPSWSSANLAAALAEEAGAGAPEP